MRVVDLLERSYRLYKKKLAVNVLNEEKIPYSKLRNISLSLANNLIKNGYGNKIKIILFTDKNIYNFYFSFACSYLGACLIPLSTNLTKSELKNIVNDCKPNLIITDNNNHNKLNFINDTSTILIVDTKFFLENYFNLNLSEEIIDFAKPEDINLIIYTSGTSGNPKGVCLSQNSLCFNAFTASVSQNLKHDDKFLSITPLYHAAAGVRIFTMICDGQTHYVLSNFDTHTFFQCVKKYRITTTIAVPTQLRKILDFKTLKLSFLNSLRLLIYGAAPSDTNLIKDLIRIFPNKLCQGYGLSEAVSQLTSLSPEDHEKSKNNEKLLKSVGKPIVGVNIEIRDNDGIVLANNKEGNIFVKTDKLMTEYYNNNKETEKVLIGGWLKTGDIGMLDENGYLFLLGRAKEMIISGGINVFPAEIENALMEHEFIEEAAVIGIKDDYWGEIPYAFIKKSKLTELSDLECIEWLKGRISKYKIPKNFEFVEYFPKTPTGKIIKKRLT